MFAVLLIGAVGQKDWSIMARQGGVV